MTFKSIIGALASLLIPGAGHLLYGHVLYAFFWLIAGLLTGGIVNVLCAAHVFYIGWSPRPQLPGA